MNWKRHASAQGRSWIAYQIWRGEDTDTRTVEARCDELLAWAAKQRRTSFSACREFADTLWMNAIPIIRILKAERQVMQGEVPLEDILVENEALTKALAEALADDERGEYLPALSALMKATDFLDRMPDDWEAQVIFIKLARADVKELHPEFVETPSPQGAEPSSGAAALPDEAQPSPPGDGSNLPGAG